MVTPLDAIVLGAGPAGLTAAMYLARAKKRVVVLDTGMVGGQPNLTHMVANYPGVGEIAGWKLAAQMKGQAESFGCEIRGNLQIAQIQLEGPSKHVELAGGDVLEAPILIIATGGTPRELGAPGEKQFQSLGISYCATCDGDFFTGQDIAVVGGGNTAIEEAVALTAYAKHVTVLHLLEDFQAFPEAVEEARKNPKIELRTQVQVLEFAGGEDLERVHYRDLRDGSEHDLPVQGAFIFIGYKPSSEPFADVLSLDGARAILGDEGMATNVPGVFVAGDVRAKRFRQLTTAVADGTIAALSALDLLHDGETGAAAGDALR